eukprot:scaffold1526_cov88-Isochrysis_galbana.AAC.2
MAIVKAAPVEAVMVAVGMGEVELGWPWGLSPRWSASERKRPLPPARAHRPHGLGSGCARARLCGSVHNHPSKRDRHDGAKRDQSVDRPQPRAGLGIERPPGGIDHHVGGTGLWSGAGPSGRGRLKLGPGEGADVFAGEDGDGDQRQHEEGEEAVFDRRKHGQEGVVAVGGGGAVGEGRREWGYAGCGMWDVGKEGGQGVKGGGCLACATWRSMTGDGLRIGCVCVCAGGRVRTVPAVHLKPESSCERDWGRCARESDGLEY